MQAELASAPQQALDVLGDARVALVEDLGDQLGITVGAEDELGEVVGVDEMPAIPCSA